MLMIVARNSLLCWHITQLEEAKTELVRMRGRETELQDQILQEQEIDGLK